MYEAHFGLANLPFRIAPDPRFYVDAAPHRAAIRALLDGLQRGHEFIPLTGEFGAGKTTVARRMLEEVDRARHVVGELPRRRVEGDDLLERVIEALGLRGAKAIHPLGGLIRQLEGLVRDGRDALLLVDEAHQLDVDALKQLRELTAVRVEGRAALHVYLVGRSTPPGLEELQRISGPLNIGAPVRVESLDAAGTREYILERLGRAGWTGHPAFDEGTTAEIHARCKGNPGRINRLCGHILLQLYMQGRNDVNADVVRAVDQLLQSELKGESATLALPPLARASPGPDTLAEAPPAVAADSGLKGEPATLALPPLARASPGPDTRAEVPPAGAVDSVLYIEALMASLTAKNLPALRPPDAGLVVPALEATSGFYGGKPQRRGLAQGVAAVALLISGGVLWQAISGPATGRSEQTRHVAAPAASSVAATAPAAHDAAPFRTALSSPTAPAPQTAPTTLPTPLIPATAGIAAMAEQSVAQSPTGAGPTAPAAPATATAAPEAKPIAAVVSARSPHSRRAGAAGGRDGGHRRALPADERHAESTMAALAPAVAATAACTLEGETLGLCKRSRAREPVRVAAPEPAPNPARDLPPDAVRTPPPVPSCEPTRAALGLCPQGSRAAP